MMGNYDPRSSKIFDSINAIAGMNKELVKEWILTQPISNGGKHKFVSDKYADRLASLIMASHYIVGEAIINEYINYCEGGINPETSPTFRRKILSKAIPAHSHTLQEKASDFSLRASSTKHKVKENKTKESDWGF